MSTSTKPKKPPAAGELVLNLFKPGTDWFEQGIADDVEQLLIHVFGDEFSLDHLSSLAPRGLVSHRSQTLRLGREL
ncbi:MAG: hypothetical protein DME19_00010 [Verrucomicrobia bacterium]|nr:MAG: hypothetical protein DME19_00010 [Verrucomicrobiota bacterium]